MVALVASDVTVTIERRAIEGKTRRNRVKIAFGDSALTYPTGGVPLPSFSGFGMKLRLDYLTVFDEGASGFMHKYDKENNKLLFFAETTVATNAPLLETTTALAPAAQVLYAEAVGW